MSRYTRISMVFLAGIMLVIIYVWLHPTVTRPIFLIPTVEQGALTGVMSFKHFWSDGITFFDMREQAVIHQWQDEEELFFMGHANPQGTKMAWVGLGDSFLALSGDEPYDERIKANQQAKLYLEDREFAPQLLYHVNDERPVDGEAIGDVGWSPNGERLLYIVSSNVKNSDYRIENELPFTIHFAEQNGERITSIEGNGAFVLLGWSPNSQYVAFNVFDAKFNSFHVYDAQGTELLQVIGAKGIRWSPDGNQLITQFCSVSCHITHYDFSTLPPKADRIHTGETTFWYLDWSPDGKWLSYWDKAEADFALLRPDGSEHHLLGLALPSGAKEHYPRDGLGRFPAIWSPDSEWIAFEGFREIYVIKADQSEQHRLDDRMGSENDVSVVGWSPDSQFLAMESAHLWVWSPNTDTLLPLSEDFKAEQLTSYDYYGKRRYAVWSPDSHFLAFVHRQAMLTDDVIYVVEIATNQVRRIPSQPTNWSKSDGAIIRDLSWYAQD